MENYFWFALFVAMNGSLILLLALHVSRLRIVKRIPFGDGNDVGMNQAIRAHANALEHVLITALLILALGMVATSTSVMATLVIAFTVSRLFHAYGMNARVFNARRLGAGITYLCELFAIVILFINLVTLTDLY